MEYSARLQGVRCWTLFAATLLIASTPVPARTQDYDALRDDLVGQIERHVLETASLIGRARLDQAVIEAMGTVERHEFVPEQLLAQSYEDRPLPIGAGQTISQPYIVALMTDLAEVGPDSVVLEIGTGSGYQAAVLAEIVDHVYTIEIVETLGRRATDTLARLGYDNVDVRIGDGYQGWPEFAPFDAILVTAAPEEVPAPLVEQLAVGGKMVIPVGPQDSVQYLRVLEKSDDGTVSTRNVLPVRFVPFTREN